MSSGDSLRENLDSAERLLTKAAAGGAKLAVLPEFFPLLAADETLKLNIAEEDGNGEIQEFLATIAKSLGMYIIGGTIPLRASAGHVFSTCLVYSDEGVRLARYDKIHLFRFATESGLIDETKTVAAGDTPQTVSTPWGNIGISICYDLRFPELFRDMNADIICVSSAFTMETGRAHWEILLRCRAIENLAYVVASSQGGKHPGGRKTYGHSMVIDPWGNILAEAGDSEEAVLFANIDNNAKDAWRARLPALNHRRLATTAVDSSHS